MTKFLVILVLLSFLSSCATYQSRVSPARDQVKFGQCESALKTLKELSQVSDGDQLVHLMEFGSALQICKDYELSNQVLIKADKLSDELDYHSATRVVGATLMNEEMIQYKGDSFEKLFINASLALNYLQLAQFDDAMVEVRRINDKFKKFNSDNKKKFELNSFSQYLSGLIWEMDQKYDDACLSYKMAFKIDPSYRGVALDALKGCWLAKRTLDFELLSKEINPSEDELKQVKQKSKNEIIIIFMQGWGPIKAPRPEYRNFPYLTPVYSQTQSLQLEAENQTLVSQPIYSVEKAAIETLNDDFGYLIARRVGARVAKEVIADQIRQKDKVLGEIARFVLLASERADLRQWTMLPQTIQVIRFSGVSSNQTLKLSGLDRNGVPIEDLGILDVGSVKKKKIFLVRSLK